MRLSFTIDENVTDLFLRAIAFGADMSETMHEVAGRMQLGAQQRFESELDPDGVPWQPSQRALRGSGKTLQDTGDLLSAASSDAALDWGADYAAHGVEASFGAAVYARIHQLGGTAGRGGSAYLPARPYLGMSDADADAIEEIIARDASEALFGGDA